MTNPLHWSFKIHFFYAYCYCYYQYQYQNPYKILFPEFIKHVNLLFFWQKVLKEIQHNGIFTYKIFSDFSFLMKLFGICYGPLSPYVVIFNMSNNKFVVLFYAGAGCCGSIGSGPFAFHSDSRELEPLICYFSFYQSSADVAYNIDR